MVNSHGFLSQPNGAADEDKLDWADLGPVSQADAEYEEWEALVNSHGFLSQPDADIIDEDKLDWADLGPVSQADAEYEEWEALVNSHGFLSQPVVGACEYEKLVSADLMAAPLTTKEYAEWEELVNSYGFLSFPDTSIPLAVWQELSDVDLYLALLPRGGIPRNERRIVYVFVDHSNLTIVGIPADMRVLTAHIEQYGIRRKSFVAGTGLTHATMPGNSYEIVCNIQPGRPENGLPDIALINRAYDIVDEHERNGIPPETLVLCTGDGNNENGTRNGRRFSFPAVARYAISRGWKVVIYSRNGRCNARLIALANDMPHMVTLFSITNASIRLYRRPKDLN